MSSIPTFIVSFLRETPSPVGFYIGVFLLICCGFILLSIAYRIFMSGYILYKIETNVHKERTNYNLENPHSVKPRERKDNSESILKEIKVIRDLHKK